MRHRATVVLDTSVINAWKDKAQLLEPLIRAMESSFALDLTAVNVDEIMSTPCAEERDILIAHCRRLLNSGKCISPPHWILEKLIYRHSVNAPCFRWQQVDVRERAYENAIFAQDYGPASLPDQQLTEQRRINKEFNVTLEGQRHAVPGQPSSSVVANSFREYLEKVGNEGSLWQGAQILYEAAALYHYLRNIDPSIEDRDERDVEARRFAASRCPDGNHVRAFVSDCPPLKAALHAITLARYDRVVRPRTTHDGDKFKAGRNDLMMAVYLPYADYFISNDKAQVKCLKEISSTAFIKCEVLSLEEFDKKLSI